MNTLVTFRPPSLSAESISQLEPGSYRTPANIEAPIAIQISSMHRPYNVTIPAGCVVLKCVMPDSKGHYICGSPSETELGNHNNFWNDVATKNCVIAGILVDELRPEDSEAWCTIQQLGVACAFVERRNRKDGPYVYGMPLSVIPKKLGTGYVYILSENKPRVSNPLVVRNPLSGAYIHQTHDQDGTCAMVSLHTPVLQQPSRAPVDFVRPANEPASAAHIRPPEAKSSFVDTAFDSTSDDIVRGAMVSIAKRSVGDVAFAGNAVFRADDATAPPTMGVMAATGGAIRTKKGSPAASLLGAQPAPAGKAPSRKARKKRAAAACAKLGLIDLKQGEPAGNPYDGIPNISDAAIAGTQEYIRECLASNQMVDDARMDTLLDQK